MTKISEETGLSRPSLYKALSDGAKPQFATIMKVLKANSSESNVCLKKITTPQQRLYLIA